MKVAILSCEEEEDMSDKSENRTYPLNQIYFYLTEGCNLRCRHCWVAPKYQEEGTSYPVLDLDLFNRIIEQAKPLGLACVKLTGGEPLLHPQIQDILELIRAEDLQLTMETNGILCSPELAREIVACRDASVSVSLDGANPETHEWVRGIPGCFEEALRGIQNLVEVGLRPQVIMTIMRHNKNEMEAVVRLAERSGAGSVKFNIVQPTSRGERMHASGEALQIEEFVELGRWVENTLSASANLQVDYDHPAAFRPLGRMFANDGKGCGTCEILSIIGVLSNGSYALCGIGETVPDLVFGHAAKDALENIWYNTPLLLQLREGIPRRFEKICGGCFMKAMCLGSCIAQNYYQSKNIWAPFWYCEAAHNRGLFPETRLPP